MECITRSEVLKIMEEKEVGGKTQFFSIEFYTKNGEIRYIAKARSCGLKEWDTKNRMRNIKEVDERGNDSSHPIAISIDMIRKFNERRVRI